VLSIQRRQIDAHPLGIVQQRMWMMDRLEPEATFLTLLETRYGGSVRGPFNLEARYQAGFSAEEMRALETL